MSSADVQMGDDTHVGIPNGDLNDDENSPPRHEYLEPTGGLLGKFILVCWSSLRDAIRRTRQFWSIGIKLVIGAAFFAYLGFVIKTYIDRGQPLDWCYGYGKAFLYFGLVIWCVIYYQAIKCYTDKIFTMMSESAVMQSEKFGYVKIACIAVFLVGFTAAIIYDSHGQTERLRSLLGILSFIVMGAIFSKHPDFIRWGALFTGLSLHIVIGLLTIKFEAGRDIVKCIGNSVVMFLECGYEGASFVFGFLVSEKHIFAFESLSVLYFLSTVVYVLFYLGWMQRICFKVGGFIQYLMGTTVIESVNSVTTIFLGMSEAPLLYAEYIKLLTPSELHTIMTAGFATVAGTLLAAYTALGIDPKNVITASAMAAPGALTFGKLFYPENRKSITSSTNIEMIHGKDKGIIDAACTGAFNAIGIVASIIALVIASVSLVGFANQTTVFLGGLVGVDGFTVDYILGKVFIPLAWLMGVKTEDCSRVASLIGLKSFINEFVAYQKLGEYKKAGLLSVRSETIATFALCGFANPGSLASNIALLTKLAPNQSTVISRIAVRALIAGSITSFTSATIAGLLMEEEPSAIIPGGNSTMYYNYMAR
ncbi:Sodium nucleoside cotransporter [Nesidiocoris tenuis]|uniref:Sodium nucleoside cotransporter n=1 Tax=Nesidiocoris tenuis TaxID=355587 RepID=A0ABN7AQD8_9HEMI|nr:Sodium nucleoside cotransporter [Nesidiocoris tenuis]